MASLTNVDRGKITTGLMRYWSRYFVLVSGLSKTDLKDTVDAVDNWIEDNQGSFNSALPTAAKNNLTAEQKTLMFCIVAAFRVSKQFAIRLIGGID